ncbi:hypothetical protein [Crystallibacter crystallopoietes]|nr:hypothetical protein [Arthrobacter crystallopoietes]
MEDGRLSRDDAGSAEAILAGLKALESFNARDAEADEIEPGSALALLEAQFASSHGVGLLLKQSLAAAMDNLQALRRLLFADASTGAASYRLYTHAPYSLVRTVIECGSTVLWALLPEDGRERARRSLVLIARDVFNAASFWDTYLEEFHPERHAEAVEYFDGLRHEVNASAAAMGLPPIFSRKADGRWGYTTKNRTQTAILKDLQAEDQLPPELLYVWQFCSGYSHGLVWASGNGGLEPSRLDAGEGAGGAEPGVLQASGGDEPAMLHAPDGAEPGVLGASGGMEQLQRVCRVAFDVVPRAWEVFDLRRRAWPLI